MKNNKSKSLQRSKKSFFAISKAVAKEGCSTLLPGSGLAFAAIETLANHGRQMFKDRAEARLLEFHQHLLEGYINEAEKRDFIEKPISLEDYNSLLHAAIQDDEDRKVTLYANLLMNLSKGRIPSEHRLHILKTAKGLTSEEAELIRKIHIHSKYDIMSKKGSSVGVSSFLSADNLKDRLIKQNLVRLGVLDEKSSQNYEPNEFLHLVAQAFYSEQELQPSSIGEIAWSGIAVMIVSFRLDVHRSTASKLAEVFRKYRIQSAIGVLNDRSVKKVNVFDQGFIFLLDSTEVPEMLKKASSSLNPNKLIIKLLLRNPDGSIPKDSLPELEADEVLPFQANSQDDLNLFDKLIEKYVRTPT